MTWKGLLAMTPCELGTTDAILEQLQHCNWGDAVMGSEFERKCSLIENLLCSRYSTHMRSTTARKVVASPSTVEEKEAKRGSVTWSGSHRQAAELRFETWFT